MEAARPAKAAAARGPVAAPRARAAEKPVPGAALAATVVVQLVLAVMEEPVEAGARAKGARAEQPEPGGPPVARAAVVWALGVTLEIQEAVERAGPAGGQEARATVHRAARLAPGGGREPVVPGAEGALAERSEAETAALSAALSSGATMGMAVAAPATNQVCARLGTRADLIARLRFAVAMAMRIGAHARLTRPGWTRWRRCCVFRATAAPACPAAWTPTARPVLSAA